MCFAFFLRDCICVYMHIHIIKLTHHTGCGHGGAAGGAGDTEETSHSWKYPIHWRAVPHQVSTRENHPPVHSAVRGIVFPLSSLRFRGVFEFSFFCLIREERRTHIGVILLRYISYASFFFSITIF